jgi:hypothetical protein
MDTTLTVKRYSAPGQKPEYAIQHLSVPYGVLLGSKLDQDDPETPMIWYLSLVPNGLVPKDWDTSYTQKQMSLTQAIERLEIYANRQIEDEKKGLVARIKYTTALGFEHFVTEHGYTSDQRYAKTFTREDANNFLMNASGEKGPVGYGDKLVSVTVVEKPNSRYVWIPRKF